MSFFQFAPIILASNSPRRKQLLADAGISFVVKSKNIPEIYSPALMREQVPLYLSKIKAEAFSKELEDEILIAADTIVHLEGRILEKPSGSEGAIAMLHELSGRTHEVITGVTLLYHSTSISFHEVTEVTFGKLSKEEIAYYVNTFSPFDKAGSYGIQEWIGLTGIESIKGCFYNVMGLPVHRLLKSLKQLK